MIVVICSITIIVGIKNNTLSYNTNKVFVVTEERETRNYILKSYQFQLII